MSRKCSWCGKAAPEDAGLETVWWSDYECCSEWCTANYYQEEMFYFLLFVWTVIAGLPAGLSAGLVSAWLDHLRWRKEMFAAYGELPPRWL